MRVHCDLVYNIYFFYFRTCTLHSNAFRTAIPSAPPSAEKSPMPKTGEKEVGEGSSGAKSSGTHSSSRARRIVTAGKFIPPSKKFSKAKLKSTKKEKVVKKLNFDEEEEGEEEKAPKKHKSAKKKSSGDGDDVVPIHLHDADLLKKIADLRTEMANMKYEKGQAERKLSMVKELLEAKDDIINTLKAQIASSSSAKKT